MMANEETFIDGTRLGRLEEAMDWVKGSMADTNRVVRESHDLLIAMQDVPGRVKSLEDRVTTIEGEHHEEKGRFKAVHLVVTALGAGAVSPAMLEALKAAMAALGR